jgi:hypothetical protein
MQKGELKNQLVRGGIEFVVIVIGVLVALAADEWREERADRVAEAEYVARLVLDLQEDVASLRRAEAGFAGKKDALERLASLDPTEVVGQRFAEDVASASAWSWDLTAAHSTTYEEMRSAGRLGLIRDADLRGAIAKYYADYADFLGSIDARRTDMGPISYRLVRRPDPEQSPDGRRTDGRAATLTPDEISQLNSFERLEELRLAATAELNFAYHSARSTGLEAADAEALMESLIAFLES